MSKLVAPMLTGIASRRAAGVRRELERRARAARKEARDPSLDERYAASLRGKAKGYDEAAHLVRALETGRQLRRRFGRGAE